MGDVSECVCLVLRWMLCILKEEGGRNKGQFLVYFAYHSQGPHVLAAEGSSQPHSVMLSAATGLGVGLLPVGWSAGQESSCLVPRSPLGIYAAGSLLHPARPGRNPWQELWKCCRLLKLFRCLSGCVFLCDFFFFLHCCFPGIPEKGLVRSCRLSHVNS